MVILFSAYRIGQWSAVWGTLIFLIACPVILIMTLSLCLYLSLFFENRKYKEDIAKILADYPHGKLMQISDLTWTIISKSTEEPIVKIFVKSTGEIATVNLKSKK